MKRDSTDPVDRNESSGLNRREFLGTVGTVTAGVALTSGSWFPASAQSARPRVSIDDPSFDVAKYAKAVGKLIASPSNPVSTAAEQDYTYLAKLHNDVTVGPCEHHWSAFLPWHRACLWRFEQALQTIDRSLMIPYWDWTMPPTGRCYPKAFEDPSSPLFQDVRNSTARKTRNNIPGMCPPFEPSVIAEVLAVDDWERFGGGLPSREDGGKAPFAGSLEAPYHNHMHGWIGGALSYTNTAAFDPIFWSFHCFIDLLFAQWQDMHPQSVITGRDVPLNGMAGTAVATTKDILDTKKLGYYYTYPNNSNACAHGAVGNTFVESHPKIVREAGANLPLVVNTYPITIPEAGFKMAEIQLTDIGHSSKFAYAGYVYLHPTTVDFKPESREFRLEYLAGFYSIWTTHDGHHGAGGKTSTRVDLTKAISNLVPDESGKDWLVSIAISTVDNEFVRKYFAEKTNHLESLKEETAIGDLKLIVE